MCRRRTAPGSSGRDHRKPRITASPPPRPGTADASSSVPPRGSCSVSKMRANPSRQAVNSSTAAGRHFLPDVSAWFLSPRLHKELVNHGRRGIIKMADQCFPVFFQFGLVEQSCGDDLLANGINQRYEVRATVVSEHWRFDGYFDLDIFNA